jgi:hypothetical protein
MVCMRLLLVVLALAACTPVRGRPDPNNTPTGDTGARASEDQCVAAAQHRADLASDAGEAQPQEETDLFIETCLKNSSAAVVSCVMAAKRLDDADSCE